jgi:hypothetical protein
MNLSPEVKSHDRFNIGAVAVIVLLDLFYLSEATDFALIGSETLGVEKSHIADVLLTAFGVYLVADVTWVTIVPGCVMSDPVGIIFHHLVCLVLLAVTFTVRQFSWHFALGLLVETNTIFLTLRRNVHTGSTLHAVFNALFYITWVALRLGLFPVLVVFLCSEYNRYSVSAGTYLNVMLLAPMLQAVITAMSFKWTYDMAMKLLRPSNGAGKLS